MARDLCVREHCWDEQEVLGYQPAPDFKLLAYPSNVCLPEIKCPIPFPDQPKPPAQRLPQCCEDTKEVQNIIAYYRFLRESGFSLLYLGTGVCSAILASRAGWTKDQIVLNASGKDLMDLAIAETVWNNIWGDQHPTTGDKKFGWIEYPAPPFHDVYYDEPNLTKDDDHPILQWSGIEGKETNFKEPNFPDFLYEPGFLKQFCSCDFYKNDPECIYNKWFHDGPLDRLWLMSIFIHECLKTTFTIGENNTWYNNYYEDVAESTSDNYYPSGGIGKRWIDAVMYTDYVGAFKTVWTGDVTDEWDAIEKLGYSGQKAWISLKENWGELDDLLHAARARNYKELWMFFQPNDKDKKEWNTCEEEYKRVIEFREAAVRHGMIYKIGPWHRRCISVEIPGCRESLKKGGKGKYTIDGYNPWLKEEIFP
jgi:hypothetical protein